MIKSLKIQNFQSHAETKLSFSQGVNIIIGNTDAGKTAIIRALRWVIRNKPSGNAIRSFWGGVTRVRLCTEEGIIIRSKDKKDKYTLRLPGREEMVFTAFGTSVPEEINRVLNVNEINIQHQLDSHFLLSKSSGEVAQHFNKVAHLDKIDLSTQTLNKEIKSLKANLVYKRQERKRLSEELTQYDHLEKFEAEVEVLEIMDRRYVNLLRSETKLESLLNNIQDKKAEVEEASKILEFETPVNNLLTLYNKLNVLKTRRDALSKALSNISYITVQIEDTKARHTRLLKEYKESFPDVCPFCGTNLI